MVTEARAKLKVTISASAQQVATAAAAATKSIDQLTGRVTAAQTAFAAMGKTAVGLLGVRQAGLFAISAVRDFAAFDDVLRRTAAIGALTADQTASLRAEVSRLGATTQFTATQVGEASRVLAQAGFTFAEMRNTLPATLSLSAAGGLELANAADIMAISLRGFGLEAGQAGRVVDVLAKTANASNTSVEMLGEAMKFAAPAAAGANISFEKTNAVLAVLADRGIRGEMGGTALRNILLQMNTATAEGAALMEKYGIRVRDAWGNTRNLQQVLRDIERGTAKLGTGERLEVLSKLFEARGATAVQALLNAGVDSITEMENKLRDAGGAAEEMATQMEAGVGGSIRRLTAAWEGFKLSLADDKVLQALIEGTATVIRASSGDPYKDAHGAGTAVREWLIGKPGDMPISAPRSVAEEEARKRELAGGGPAAQAGPSRLEQLWEKIGAKIAGARVEATMLVDGLWANAQRKIKPLGGIIEENFLKPLTAGLEKAHKQFAALTDDWQRRIDTFGMDAFAAGLHDLKSAGVFSPAQIAKAEKLAEQLRRLEMGKTVGDLERDAGRAGMGDKERRLDELRQQGATAAELERAAASLDKLTRADIDRQIQALMNDALEVGLSDSSRQIQALIRAGATREQVMLADDAIREREQKAAAMEQAELARQRAEQVSAATDTARRQAADRPATSAAVGSAEAISALARREQQQRTTTKAIERTAKNSDRQVALLDDIRRGLVSTKPVVILEMA